MRTPIFASGKGRSQSGLTLLELLIALTLIASAGVAVAGAVMKPSPRTVLKTASEQLVVDLKRARFEATQSRTPISITFSDEGYAVDQLKILRTWPKGVEAVVEGTRSEALLIAHDHTQSAFVVTLAKNRAEVKVEISAMTRQIFSTGA